MLWYPGGFGCILTVTSEVTKQKMMLMEKSDYESVCYHPRDVRAAFNSSIIMTTFVTL